MRGRDFAERGANGVGNIFGGADVGFADAGDQSAGRQGDEGVDGTWKCGGEDSFRRQLDGGGGPAGLAVGIDLFRKEFKLVLSGWFAVDSGQ